MKCALPDHLKERNHEDWLWPLSYLPRHFNAKGPRCEKGTKGYLSWPPKLKEGKSIVRWENNFSKSRIFIPSLMDVYVTGKDLYGMEFNALEEGTGLGIKVKLDWWEQTWDEIETGIQLYSPSALQKFSKEGWMKLEQGYYAKWKILKQREFFTHKTGEDTVLFYRSGWRCDSVDLYWNFGPYAGLRWE